MQIDEKKIERELQELAGDWPVKVKADKKKDTVSTIRETDKLFLLKLNPLRIRSEATLNKHVDIARREITWTY
jgi:hypothetical protein